MWYGQRPPWMQSSPTLGAGMPPYGQNMPMPMQRPEMRPPSALSSNVPLPQGQGRSQPGGAVSPALMGMLSALLASRQPGAAGLVPTAGGQPVPGQGPVTEPSAATGAMTGAAGSPAGAAPADTDIIGMLARFFSGGR